MMTCKINEILMDIFKSHFSTNAINADMNFFDMGITSVELLSICNELAKHLNRDINIIMLYEHPTISLLSKELSTVMET